MPSNVLQIKGVWDITTYRLLIITEVPREYATAILFMDLPEDEGRTLLSYIYKYLSVDINSYTRTQDTAIRKIISRL
jgi:hypothetical protein